MPSELALSKLFHVGRQSIREALRVLEISGFITVKPGVKGGAVIESTVLSKLASLYLDAIKLQSVSLEDCMEARKAIELSVIELAIVNAGKSDIDMLQENVLKARARQRRGNPAFEENIEFHRLLAKTSKNHTFTIVMESLLMVFADLKSKHVEATKAQSSGITAAHEALIDAIKNRNREGAIKLLKKDLALAEEILL